MPRREIAAFGQELFAVWSWMFVGRTEQLDDRYQFTILAIADFQRELFLKIHGWQHDPGWCIKYRLICGRTASASSRVAGQTDVGITNAESLFGSSVRG